LGELIAEGREVDIAFSDIGRLVLRGDREPRFNFSAELYAIEGLEPPQGAIDEGSLKAPTAAAFRRTVPKESKGLGIRGSAATAAPAVAVDLPPAAAAAPQAARPPPAPQESYDAYPEENYPGGEEEPVRGLTPSPSAPSLAGSSGGRSPSLTNQQYKREAAYKKAMDRHIGAMEARASEVASEADAWNQHVVDCLSQERDEITEKRQRAQMNLHFLQHQMNLTEEKRKEQRREDIVAASAHDFPRFKQAEDSEKKEFALGQQARVRADLDDQVRTNNTLRNIAKQRERALEINQLEANRQEMAMLRDAERQKRSYDREALATAWNSDIRMKNIWKAIDTYKGSGASTTQVMTDDAIPPSRGGSVRSAGRIMTGSSRRVPLGASNSLGQIETRLATGQR
jgi:hypothetical protein